MNPSSRGNFKKGRASLFCIESGSRIINPITGKRLTSVGCTMNWKILRRAFSVREAIWREFL